MDARERAYARAASPAGLTRGSITLQKTFLRRRWIAGSSPAMTVARVKPGNDELQ
jgi:hypothetical protein